MHISGRWNRNGCCVVCCTCQKRRKTFLLFGLDSYQKVNLYIENVVNNIDETVGREKNTHTNSMIILSVESCTSWCKSTKRCSVKFFVPHLFRSDIFSRSLFLLTLCECVNWVGVFAFGQSISGSALPMRRSRLQLWRAVKFTMRIVWEKWESRVELPKGTFYLFKHIHIKLKNTLKSIRTMAEKASNDTQTHKRTHC